MSWSGSPKTWTDVLVNAADLNLEIRDRFNVLKTSINDDGSLKVGLDRSTTEQDVNTTTVETSIYSFSVPGGTLSTNKAVRLTLTGNYLNNSGSPDTFTIRGKFGGTTFVSGAPSLGAGANRRTMKLVIELNANGLTNSQRAIAMWDVGASAAQAAFDATESFRATAYHGALAIDTTTAQTLQVTIQHGTSSASISFKRFLAALELIG